MLVSLPSEAVRACTRLLNRCERRPMWPTQIRLGIIARLPKSAESERPVCIPLCAESTAKLEEAMLRIGPLPRSIIGTLLFEGHRPCRLRFTESSATRWP
eukprot:2735657-Pyramimonas_sp.AAC.1